MSGKIVFITGGARSGKSSFALREASSVPGRRIFIATAEAVDGEMKERIERHRSDRGDGWETIEEPLRIAEAIDAVSGNPHAVVLDCLTLWLSNVMQSGSDAYAEIETLMDVLKRFSGSAAAALFIVSNEVGMGIVPDSELARRFRDLAGMLNQKVAGISDAVYWTASGIPIKIK